MNGINIQNIDSWYEGQPIVINFFSQQIVQDDLSTFAKLEYYMINKNVIDQDTIAYTIVFKGNLTINEPDYTTWNNDPDANDWIYNWSLNQLNLTQVP